MKFNAPEARRFAQEAQAVLYKYLSRRICVTFLARQGESRVDARVLIEAYAFGEAA